MTSYSNNGFLADEEAGTSGKPADLPLNQVEDEDPPDGEKTQPERQQWTSSLEFLMSCISMSVGLGNVWRFPFIALENGGGAFVLPYIIILLLVGKPIYYMGKNRFRSIYTATSDVLRRGHHRPVLEPWQCQSLRLLPIVSRHRIRSGAGSHLRRQLLWRRDGSDQQLPGGFVQKSSSLDVLSTRMDELRQLKRYEHYQPVDQ
jgi:Sodium:neurotransmitter symporter family